MANLKFKARGLSNPQSKTRIYFCCHPKDFEPYFDIISNAVLSEIDCAIWYCDNLARDKYFFDDLSSMKLFVVPVTPNLIKVPNEIIDSEISFAKEHKIPILPIVTEKGLEDDFCHKWGSFCSIELKDTLTSSREFQENLKSLLSSYLIVKEHEGSWIFLSHSSRDIEKVRIIRNEFEKHKQNPLAFHLKCLRTDTQEGCKELEDLIKREIDARDWFVFCESEAAKKSTYVNMEKEYVLNRGKKKIYSIDMSLPIDEILKKVDEICVGVKLFISYQNESKHFVKILASELSNYDFDVWYDERLISGESFNDTIANEIRQTSAYGFFIAIISEGYEQSYCCQIELPFAIMNNTKVIPILIGDVPIPALLKQHKCYRLPKLPKAEDIRLIAELIEAETRRQIKGPICQADAYNAISRINEKLNYENRYHPEEAVLEHVTGALDDYLEIYRFPCCGKTIVVGDGPVSRFRSDGCCCDNE